MECRDPPEGALSCQSDHLFSLHREYLTRNESLPLVVDDVLIRFDNERAAAALEVLAELSARTQVIFFTHHRHLLTLAEAAVPPGALFRHELNE